MGLFGSSKETCSTCMGKGRIPYRVGGKSGTAGCPNCRGQGKIKKGAGGFSDHNHSKMTFRPN